MSSERSEERRLGVRGALTCAAFAVFFGVAAVLALGVRLWPRAHGRAARRRFTARLNRGFRLFLGLLDDVGLIEAAPVAMPAGLAGRPFLLVANHPTLLDAPLLLAAMPELVSLVKADWYRSVFLGPLLARCDHVRGPGRDAASGELAPVVRRITGALRGGRALLAFPEATRSPRHGLRRFRRGALEAALEAGVPIVPLFIGVDPPILGKGDRPWRMPARVARYRFEWLAPVPEDVRARGSRAVARDLEARLGAHLEAFVRPPRGEAIRGSVGATAPSEAAVRAGSRYPRASCER